MLESNLPADAGTADDAELSLDEAVTRATSKSEPESVPASELEQTEDEKPEPEVAKAEEQPEEETDDRPDWDKPDKPEEEEGAEDDQTTDGGRFVSHNGKVRLDDGSIATVGELARNNLFHKDYTQKTQQLAEERNSAYRQFVQAQQLEQALAQERQVTQALLNAIIPKRWTAQEVEADPVGAQIAHAKREEVESYLRQYSSMQQQNADALQRQYAEIQGQVAQQEMNRLLESMPQLRDTKKREAFVNDLRESGHHYGYSDDELGAINDSRHMKVLADATRYRKLMAGKTAAKAKPAPNRPPVMKPGRRPAASNTASAAVKSAEERLRTTGSLEAATELFLARKANAARA